MGIIINFFKISMSILAMAAFAIEAAEMNDVMSVPDYVSGFIYGMTGDNHLTEIEACYNGGSDVVTKA